MPHDGVAVRMLSFLVAIWRPACNKGVHTNARNVLHRQRIGSFAVASSYRNCRTIATCACRNRTKSRNDNSANHCKENSSRTRLLVGILLAWFGNMLTLSKLHARHRWEFKQCPDNKQKSQSANGSQTIG